MTLLLEKIGLAIFSYAANLDLKSQMCQKDGRN
jgi:hypothetical protein